MIISVYLPTFGVGDFIRGSIFLYKFAKSLNQEFDVDFKYSPLNQFLLNKNNYFYTRDDIIMFDKADMSYVKNEINTKPIVYLNSNAPLFDKYLTNDIKIFFSHKLEFINDEKINNIFRSYKINLNNINLFHVRFEDKYFNTNVTKNFINEKKLVLKYINKNNNNILISNSSNFKNFMKDNNFLKIIDINPVHFTFTDSNTIINTVIDMILVKKAKKIYSYNEYPWVSAFVQWAAKIYDIEIFNLNRHKTFYLPSNIKQKKNIIKPKKNIKPKRNTKPRKNTIKPKKKIIKPKKKIIKPKKKIIKPKKKIIKPKRNIKSKKNIRPKRNIKSKKDIRPKRNIKSKKNIIPKQNIIPKKNIKPKIKENIKKKILKKRIFGNANKIIKKYKY